MTKKRSGDVAAVRVASAVSTVRIHAVRGLESLETRRLMAADLVISEFLASNSSGLVDSFGDKSDWIELHNRGNAAANLGDYALTDDAAAPVKWRFPTQDLPAGGYLVVFASDRNRAIAGQQLHTNFKLAAGGEYLGLMRSEGSVVADFGATFPAQTADVSYGLTNEDSATSGRQYFNDPTPGAVNVPGAVTPTFSVPGKVFSGSVSIVLSTPTPGAQIRFTYDRSEPTLNSPLYGAPITLSVTAMIRAKTFANGFTTSATVSQSYVSVDSTVSGFDTNVGAVVIDTYGQALNDQTLVLGSGTFIDNKGDGRATFSDTPDYHGRVGVRVRGASTQTLPKKSLALELWDESNNDRKASLLGMPADSDWILYAPYMEKSLIQDPLAFQLGAQTGLLAPRLRFVEVYLNTDGGNTINYNSDYAGVYILMEKIKSSDDRVDIPELGPTDNAEPAVTGGYIFKRDRPEADETLVNTGSGQQYIMVEPKTPTAPQTTWLTNYINEFEGVLNGANYKDPVNGYAKYIDIDSWVNNYIMNEMARNVDGYVVSSYYYKDRGGKIVMGPMWDFNTAFGNAHFLDGQSASGFNADTRSAFEHPYMERLLSDPAFKQKVIDRWGELRRNLFATPKLMSDIDGWVAELSDNNGNYPVGPQPTQASNNPVVRNFKRWNLLGVYSGPEAYYDTAGRWTAEIGALKDWIIARVNWLDSVFLPAPVPSVAGGYRTSATTVTLSATRPNVQDTTLLAANAPVRAYLPSGEVPGWNQINFNDSAWLSGNGGVGYDVEPTVVDYNPLIGLNVGQMRYSTPTVYTRYAFNIADPAAIDALILKLKYDDGFVAYLNGFRVSADTDRTRGGEEDPFDIHWNDLAKIPRGDQATLSFAEFDLSLFRSLLVPGRNVLAIQVKNLALDSTDLLVVPELISRKRLTSGVAEAPVYYTTDGTDPLLPSGTLSSAAIAYTGPISISSTTRLRSRSPSNGSWSAISDAYYNFDADALRVSELMYNPAAPSAGSAYTTQDFEFIEVRNTASTPLKLAGYAFASGVTFSFPAVTLAPGGAGVIVKNLAAFQSRYGTSIVPLGVYGGSLDNAGETISIANPFGQPSQTFAYRNDWYASTNGGGASLEVTNTLTNADLNAPGNWRASLATGGTPGAGVSIDLTPPAVLATQHLFGTAPNQVAVRFSENVIASLTAGDMTATNLTTGVAANPTSMTWDAAAMTATFTFATNARTMADGNYRLTLAGAGVTDAAGNLLDGNGDGIAGGNLTFDFFVLAGDINHDRVVDFTDLVAMSQNYGKAGKTFAEGNVDYSADGIVGFDDLIIIGQQFGKSVATPAATVVAATQKTLLVAPSKKRKTAKRPS